MPGYDQSGPNGAGPLTGRQQGRCSGNTPSNSFFGGFRGGRGRRNRRFNVSYDTPNLQDEKKLLEERLAYIDAQLKK